MRPEQLVLARSVRGDWSLYPPGTTHDEIKKGQTPFLVSGPAEWDEAAGDWDRPDLNDYEEAEFKLQEEIEAHAGH